MFAGRVGGWERLQYRVRIEQPQITHEGGGIYAGLLVPIGHRNNQRIDWFRMFLRYVRDSYTGDYELTYRIGVGLSEFEDTRTVTAGSQELVAEWVQPRWYATLNQDGDPVWEVRWQDLRILLNGDEILHPFQGEGSVITDDFYPAALPLGAAELVAEAEYGYPDLSGYDFCSESFTETSVSTARVVGGYRVHDGDDWREFPIHYEIAPLLDDPCDTGLDAPPPDIEGDTTWNASITPRDYYRLQNVYHGTIVCECVDPETGDSYSFLLKLATTTESVDSRRGRMFIIPNLPREFVAIGENIPQEYLMYRAPLPRVDATRMARGFVIRKEFRGDAEVLCNQTVAQPYQLHAARDELLYPHDGNASNPLSDNLQENVHSLLMWRSHRKNIVTNIFCDPIPCVVELVTVCPPSFDFEQKIFELERVQGYLVSANCLPYYRHGDHALRYLNTHAAPFWSYICWLQDWNLDRNGDGVAEPTPVARYWRPHQCQHIDHPALPGGVRTRRRSYLLLDALAHGTWSAWINDLFGVPTGWVGSNRPALVEWLGASEHALTQDSAPRWSAQDATLVFAPTGITVTPTSTTHVLEFTLADWNAEPYLYPAVADRVRIWLPDTAYSSITIQLVSAENETVTIATTRGTHAIPHGEDSKYAGTWRRQYAAAAAGYSELGEDWDTDGVSQATFADPKRALLWQLLGARAGARLRITITQNAPTPYTLEYPRFYRDAIQHAFATDNGAHTYPHIRNAQTLNWGLLVYPIADNQPSVRLPHQPMTLYDAAALYTQLDLGEDADDTITIINQIRDWGFDDIETGGHPAGVVRVRQMCRAAMLPYTQRLALWLINDLRECPPLPTLPTRKLSTATLQFSGDWGQWLYFSAPSHRYYLAPDEPAKLMEVQGATETELTAYDRAIGRYHLTRQAVALDGTETLQHATRQWRIRAASRDLGRTTPFFSHALVPPTITKPEGGAQVVIDTRRQYLHVAIGSTLRTYHLHSRQLILQREHEGRIECLARDSRRDALLIVVRVAGVRVLYLSRDAGDTVVEVFRMTTAGLVVCAISPHMTWAAFYQDTSGVLMLRRSIDGGASWSTPVQVEIDGNPAQGTPLDAAYDARYHAVVLVYETASGDRRVALSHDDGETFITILQ